MVVVLVVLFASLFYALFLFFVCVNKVVVFQGCVVLVLSGYVVGPPCVLGGGMVWFSVLA